MNPKQIIFAILFFALLAGCEKAAVISKPAKVNLNQCYEPEKGINNYSLCLLAVVSDSRCPRDKMCIWGGVAEAKFIFRANYHTDTITLSTGGNTDTLHGYKITLLNLYPYPGDPLTETRAEVSVTR